MTAGVGKLRNAGLRNGPTGKVQNDVCGTNLQNEAYKVSCQSMVQKNYIMFFRFTLKISFNVTLKII